MWNRFAALENLEENDNISQVLESVRGNIIISAKEHLAYYKLKHIKPWCSKLLDQEQWLNYSNFRMQATKNENHMNNVTCKISWTFGKKFNGRLSHKWEDSITSVLNK
jgi:hypothetical protein